MAGLRASWRVNRLHSRARALLKQGKAAEAEPFCKEAVTLAPRSANAWLYLGWVYLDLDRPAEALEACDRALGIAPRSAWAWKNKGIALDRLKRYEEALEALSHVPLGRADDIVARNANWARITALQHMGRFDAVQAEAERLIRHNPDEPRHWYWLGTALDALKCYNEALTAYARSTKLDHLYIDGWVRQAYTLYDLRRYDEGLGVCDRILGMEPQNLHGWRAKSLCLVRERRYDEAIATYDHTLTLPNATLSDYDGKGIALLRAGRYTDAVRAYAHALGGKPDSPRYLNNLGCVYMRLQLYERALNLFERVCALDERLFNGWMSAAEALISLGRYDEAHEPLARAKEFKHTSGLSESDVACLAAWQGILHTRQAQFDEAMAAFKEALGADPDDSEACWGFAELLLALGEGEKAASMIARSLTLDPFDVRAWALKARILRAAGDAGGADEAEAHGQRLLSEQREQLAAWEREQAGQAGAE